MKLTREQIRKLARMTVATRPQELTCDEWLDRIGRFVELEKKGEAIPTELAPVAQHLEVCPDCTEEFEALRRAMEP